MTKKSIAFTAVGLTLLILAVSAEVLPDLDAKYSHRGSLYIGKPDGPSLHGQTITIIPRVDSASGDEFVADYGRVQESDEGNNEVQIRVRLR